MHCHVCWQFYGPWPSRANHSASHRAALFQPIALSALGKLLDQPPSLFPPPILFEEGHCWILTLFFTSNPTSPPHKNAYAHAHYLMSPLTIWTWHANYSRRTFRQTHTNAHIHNLKCIQTTKRHPTQTKLSITHEFVKWQHACCFHKCSRGTHTHTQLCRFGTTQPTSVFIYIHVLSGLLQLFV